MSVSIAKKVFTMFHGAWSFNRMILGAGSMKGLAIFENLSQTISFQDILYKEDGIFEFENGTKLNTHKEYIYSFENEQLGAYFVENKIRARLFH